MAGVLQLARGKRGTSLSGESLTGGSVSAYSARTAIFLFFSGPAFESDIVADLWQDVFLEHLEHTAFAALAESSFAEDWNSEADAIYDDL
jgi:hypothetical protein